MKQLLFAAVLLVSGSFSAAAVEAPAFLPSYYSMAFELGDGTTGQVDKAENGETDRAFYSSGDGRRTLEMSRTTCQPTLCAGIFENLQVQFNQLLTQRDGTFEVVEADEIVANLMDSERSNLLILVRHISSVQTWIYSAPPVAAGALESKSDIVRGLADHQRYQQARSEGNVMMGRWGRGILRYATSLLRDREHEAGLAVLRDVVATSPSLYEAHAELFRHADDAESIRTSARIVFENAESIDLVREAAVALGESLPQVDDFPLLEPNETGLQLILIPLAPVDPVFIKEAAALFSEITGIPAKIRRLPEVWQFASLNRIEEERRAEEFLVSIKGTSIDFSGWTLADYVANLKSTLENLSALDQFHLKRFVDEIQIGPGQVLVDGYVVKLNRILSQFRSDDPRTMYVGVTRRNIYSGKANFVFSHFGGRPENSSSILSYNLMLAENLGEDRQSRRRLVERMAKELVPASLKALQIQRPSDPTCPYSYSSGVDRMDEKRLRICPEVADAIEAFR